MKRSAFKVVVFLLLGAIVNVAVAWGCVKWSDQQSVIDAPVPVFNTSAIKSADHAWLTKGGWRPLPEDRIYGPTAVMPSEMAAFGLTQRAFFEFPDMRNKGGGGSGNPFVLVAYQTEAGWPWRSLRSDSFTKQGPTVSATIDLGFGPIDEELRRLPTESLWPGFAINTIFYAAVLWIVFAFPFVLRRRRRIKRGLCPACAYPVGGSPVCTECGKSLTT